MRVAPGVFAGLESAPQNRTHAERVEIIRGNNASHRALRPAADAERASRDLGHEDRVEECAAPLKIQKVWPRKSGWPGFTARCAGESKKPFLMHNRRIRTEQQPFHPTEHGRIRADA